MLWGRNRFLSLLTASVFSALVLVTCQAPIPTPTLGPRLASQEAIALVKVGVRRRAESIQVPSCTRPQDSSLQRSSLPARPGSVFQFPPSPLDGEFGRAERAHSTANLLYRLCILRRSRSFNERESAMNAVVSGQWTAQYDLQTRRWRVASSSDDFGGEYYVYENTGVVEDISEN